MFDSTHCGHSTVVTKANFVRFGYLPAGKNRAVNNWQLKLGISGRMPAYLNLLNLTYYAIAINFAAFAAFGIDKARAEAQRRRISEASLLQLALIGGSPGAYAGRHLFRHKTRKQPFSGNLHFIAALQMVALFGLATWWAIG